MHTLVMLLMVAEEQAPEAEDVKAGWLAFGIFIALVAAVAVLCFSLVRQLRKAQAAKDAGVYGDAPASGEDDSDDGGDAVRRGPGAPGSPTP